MKTLRFFTLALSLALAAVVLAPLTAWAADSKPVRILLLDGQNNHNWKATSPVLKQAFEACDRFSVDVYTSPEKGATQEAWSQWNPAFSAYDVVVSNYNGQLWPDNVRAAFEKYVSDGGGFVCVHAANNSFPEWLEYNRIIGIGGWGGRNEKSGPYLYVSEGKVVRDTAPGNGGSHGAQHEFMVELLNANHPITAGMPVRWLHAKDELYDSLRGPAENVEVLAYALSDKSKKNEPMIMTLSYGKGRVFHTPMGHADYSMKCVGFQSVMLRGTEWAATGKVTLPLPTNFPGPEAVVSAP